MLINAFQKRPDQDARYRARSTETQTTAIDQTAGLGILTTESFRFVFKPGSRNVKARSAIANRRALISEFGSPLRFDPR
jgi:hypothetical protein